MVDPGSADVVATTADGDPLLTRTAVGAGSVYVASADHLVGTDGTFLAAGTRLLDRLQDGTASAEVTGPPLQYLVNTADGRTTVRRWSTPTAPDGRGPGRLTFPAPPGRTRPCRTGRTATPGLTAVPAADGTLPVPVTVPPYGVRVISAG
ncbi:hypothetical protein BJF78_19590 [Pseudonocardia sp. CNS-139]|nr:hypothetical protein BJF78_19590 [Pseudonocardia sp. CNS-139]